MDSVYNWNIVLDKDNNRTKDRKIDREKYRDKDKGGRGRGRGFRNLEDFMIPES